MVYLPFINYGYCKVLPIRFFMRFSLLLLRIMNTL